VKNQGQCGASWAYPPVGALESAHAKATGKLVELSDQNVVDCAKTASCCNGGLFEDAYNYIIKNKGIDTAAGYPSAKPICECHFEPTKIGATMSSYVEVKAKDENALQQAIANVGPVATAVDASHTSFQLYKSGGRDSFFVKLYFFTTEQFFFI
jgi:cathepsin L